MGDPIPTLRPLRPSGVGQRAIATRAEAEVIAKAMPNAAHVEVVER